MGRDEGCCWIDRGHSVPASLARLWRPHLLPWLERASGTEVEDDKEALKEDGSGECLLPDAAPHR
jgi:hypothetical protein